MKKATSALLAAAIVLALITLPVFADAASVQQEVYTYLTENLGLNSAAAAGVMANIMCESSFNPSVGAIDTNGLYSYGLVMWNGPRYERLKTWCEFQNLSYSSVKGQMGYLKYELENGERGTLDALLAVPDTFEGCVEATVLFAELFERCAAFSYGLRTHYAVNDFWPAFGNGAPSEKRGIYGIYCNYPITVSEGSSYYLKGAVVSYVSPLSEVTAGVYDKEGNMVTGGTANPNAYCLDITKLDKYVVFGILEPGEYTYMITAANTDGQYVVEKHDFTVGKAASEGKYPRITDGVVLCGFGAFCPGAKFSDMPGIGSWSHEGIDFVISRNLFLGTSPRLFSPGSPMNRAMLVTVLHRLAGNPDPVTNTGDPGNGPGEAPADSSVEDPSAPIEEDPVPAEAVPEETGEEDIQVPYGESGEEADLLSDAIPQSEEGSSSEPETGGVTPKDPDTPAGPKTFSDVPEGMWFSDAVAWASSVGVVLGVDDEHFCPYSPVTREQLAAILHRYTSLNGLDFLDRADLSEFPDGDSVSFWATDSVSWAIAAGVIRGIGGGGTDEISPHGKATRAQVAVILKRYVEEVICE